MLGPFATANRHMPLDVDNNNNNDDNAWQRGLLWPHGMGPMLENRDIVNSCPQIKLEAGWNAATALSWWHCY